MAINYRVQENNQTVHFEGDAQITLTSDGSNVQAKLNEFNSMLYSHPIVPINTPPSDLGEGDIWFGIVEWFYEKRNKSQYRNLSIKERNE